MSPSKSPIDQSIIYQNTEQTVTLLDIPRSIVAAQGPNSSLSGNTLYSREPSQQPFRDNEPKSISAKERGNFDSVQSELHSVYASLVEDALEEVRSKHSGPWCLPRRWRSPQPRKKKRKLDVSGHQETPLDDVQTNTAVSASEDLGKVENIDFIMAELRPKITAEISMPPSTSNITMSCSTTKSISAEDVGNTDVDGLLSRRPWDPFLHNPLEQQVNLVVNIPNKAAGGPSAEHRFYIPEKSTFALADCSDASTFRESVRWMSQEYGVSRTFDFVLLDPPWPNASAKRSGAYNTECQLRDLKQLLLRMDLDTYLAPMANVAVWITNKSAVREMVLGRGGLFEAWNIRLKEEWLWVKTTTKGEPVTPIAGLWRKPYEVLLLGQRPCDPFDIVDPISSPEDVKRRIIIAVADLHSRKPCLKQLIDSLIYDRHDYRALEIFARHLISGWWSWGDEVLKFNWEGCWTSQD